MQISSFEQAITVADPPGGSGRAIVLIHGYPLDQRLWRGQRPLAERCRLVTFDLPGFGRAASCQPATSIAEMAVCVERVLDQLGLERAVLGGLSMGGYVLFECWRRFPGRIEALLCCDTRAEADPPAAAAARTAAIARIEGGAREEVVGELRAKLLAPTSAESPALRAQLQQMTAGPSDAALVAALAAMRARDDSLPTLATIDVPTLVAVGVDDALTPPEMARTIADGVNGSTLLEIPDGGHLAPWENPAAFNRGVERWLRSW